MIDGLRRQLPKLVFAFALIAFGTILVAEQLGVAGVGVLHYWFFPLALLALGLALLAQGGIGALFGVGLLILSTISTIDRLGAVQNLDAGEAVGPMLLILFGGLILWRSFGGRWSVERSERGDTVHNVALMAGHELRCDASEFRGGSLTAIMGGCELDLSGATPVAGGAELDLVAIWGGIEIRVPPEWKVVSHVTPLMGGFEDSRELISESADSKRLTLRGVAIMGSIEITT